MDTAGRAPTLAALILALTDAWLKVILVLILGIPDQPQFIVMEASAIIQRLHQLNPVPFSIKSQHLPVAESLAAGPAVMEIVKQRGRQLDLFMVLIPHKLGGRLQADILQFNRIRECLISPGVFFADFL